MSDAIMAHNCVTHDAVWLAYFLIFFFIEVAVKITGHNNRNIFITEVIITIAVPYFCK